MLDRVLEEVVDDGSQPGIGPRAAAALAVSSCASWTWWSSNAPLTGEPTLRRPWSAIGMIIAPRSGP
nr:hypothetical protein [Natrinema soli]